MTAFTTISNALVAVGAKPFATTVQALRDNPLAILEADSTAPVIPTIWNPYNKVTNGDANTGLIWSFAANGTVATVTSPDFVDGYEYAFWFDEVRQTNTVLNPLTVNFYRETSAAYSGVSTLVGSLSSSASASGYFEILMPRRVQRQHVAVLYSNALDATDVVVSDNPDRRIVKHTTAQKLQRVQFGVSGGNSITGSGSTGRIFMYRRKVQM